MTRCLFRNIHSLPACEWDFGSSNGQSIVHVKDAISEARLRDVCELNLSLSLSASLNFSLSLSLSQPWLWAEEVAMP